MDPSRGLGFTEKLCSSPSFRGKFGGLYAAVTSALQRLGHTDLPVPDFIRDKIARVRVVLADEESKIINTYYSTSYSQIEYIMDRQRNCSGPDWDE